jgi:hypothetical protein
LRAPSVPYKKPEVVKSPISNRLAAHSAFGNVFKLNVARLDAGSFPAASNESYLSR